MPDRNPTGGITIFAFTLASHFSWALGQEKSVCIIINDKFLVLKPT
jgi:hypothetical protein